MTRPRRDRPAGAPAGTGRVTIRTAAVLFLLSALVELSSIATPTPWFGALRGGATVVYHLAFVALFLAMGVGLWTGARWGYWTVFAATAAYTADRVRCVLDRPGRAAEIGAQLRRLAPELADALDMNLLLGLSDVMMLTFVACWWGFAAYIYLRRGYFR